MTCFGKHSQHYTFVGVGLRLLISDALWSTIKPVLQEPKHTAGIQPKLNRSVSVHHDAQNYKLREKVERFFNNPKQFRRVPTLYDNVNQTFTVFVHLMAN